MLMLLTDQPSFRWLLGSMECSNFTSCLIVDCFIVIELLFCIYSTVVYCYTRIHNFNFDTGIMRATSTSSCPIHSLSKLPFLSSILEAHLRDFELKSPPTTNLFTFSALILMFSDWIGILPVHIFHIPVWWYITCTKHYVVFNYYVYRSITLKCLLHLKCLIC